MKILHTADLHLDSPFEALPSAKAAERRKEQRQLLSRIADVANSENVDLVLLCGDLLDSDSSYYETGEELIRSLRRISAPVFVAPGNHDYYSEKSPYAKLELPDNVHVFSKKSVEYAEYREKGFRVFGCAFTDKFDADHLSGFSYKPTDSLLNIMCIHGEPKPDEIAGSGMNYVALGHIHKATGLLNAGGVYYSQPGCPEGRGFDETGEKYINLVTLDYNSCSLEQIAVYSRKYEILKVDVSGRDPLLAVKMALADDTVRDIYRIVLTGESDYTIDTELIRKNLNEYFYELQVVDSTKLKSDIWEKCSEDTLRGLFLSKLKAQFDEASTDEDKAMIEKAVRWGLAAVDNAEEVKIHGN